MSMSDALALSQSGSLTTNTPLQDGRPKSADLPAEPVAPSQNRVIKRRASQACRYCRAKKIKCSLVKNGSPCNTCQLDEVECLVTKSRRNMTRRVANLPSTSHSDRQESNMGEDLPAIGDALDPAESTHRIGLNTHSSTGQWSRDRFKRRHTNFTSSSTRSNHGRADIEYIFDYSINAEPNNTRFASSISTGFSSAELRPSDIIRYGRG